MLVTVQICFLKGKKKFTLKQNSKCLSQTDQPGLNGPGLSPNCKVHPDEKLDAVIDGNSGFRHF